MCETGQMKIIFIVMFIFMIEIKRKNRLQSEAALRGGSFSVACIERNKLIYSSTKSFYLRTYFLLSYSIFDLLNFLFKLFVLCLTSAMKEYPKYPKSGILSKKRTKQCHRVSQPQCYSRSKLCIFGTVFNYFMALLGMSVADLWPLTHQKLSVLSLQQHRLSAKCFGLNKSPHPGSHTWSYLNWSNQIHRIVICDFPARWLVLYQHRHWRLLQNLSFSRYLELSSRQRNASEFPP